MVHPARKLANAIEGSQTDITMSVLIDFRLDSRNVRVSELKITKKISLRL
jgi:hypothetical protein